MTVEQLCQLPLIDRVTDDAVLFLCIPGPQLVFGAHLQPVKAWCFTPTAIGFVLGKHEMVQALEIREVLPKTAVGKITKN